jgi:hypothetical protein
MKEGSVAISWQRREVAWFSIGAKVCLGVPERLQGIVPFLVIVQHLTDHICSVFIVAA